VQKAVNFLVDDRVAKTAFDEKRVFLKNKGLTDDEINEAISVANRLPSCSRNDVSSLGRSAQATPLVPKGHNKWRDFANIAVLAGGATYLTFSLIKNIVMPKWFGDVTVEQNKIQNIQDSVCDVQNGLKFLVDSVQQTLSAVQRQQELSDKLLQQLSLREDANIRLERQITELKSDLSVIKGLFLSRMGRKNKAKTYGNQSAIFNNKKVTFRDENPNPNDESYFNDEVDQFHKEKDKIPLSNIRSVSPSPSDEEVFKVAANSDEEEQMSNEYEDMSDQNHQENDVDDVEDDMASDIEEKDENDYLPSASNWGKNKKTFYNTDYIDKDYAGNVSESDEEAAQLEEIEAKALQKRLADHMTEDDFDLGFKISAEKDNYNRKAIEIKDDVDISQLNEHEKLNYTIKNNPELPALIDDFKAKFETMENRLHPIVKAIKDGILPLTDRLNVVQLRFEAYSNYLINVNFYFLLKANQINLKNHPVIDKIMHWKKIINAIDRKCEHLDKDLTYVCDRLKEGSNLSDLKFVEDDQSSPTGSETLRLPKKSKNLNESDKDEHEMALYDFEDGDDMTDEKRAATYEILKNKGTTPRRKKEERNPRVKHRRKFQKALHRKRSQVPDVKRELKKYGGEERGIKSNVVKSVKLH
uniref:Something about silencing protein 10 n=1 Tax=Romanomermis culicivorax TaxID=13658 RepID=A0A915L6G3_ROMCU